jgi:hypothetical protein
MKFNVTFRCTLLIDFDKHPAGLEMAEYLAAKLRKHDMEIHHIENYEDFAWELEFKGYSGPWILVGYVGDGVFEWLIQIISGVTWVGRLFGRSDQDLREALARKLHLVMFEDANFSEIRWHQHDFGDEGWSATPA